MEDRHYTNPIARKIVFDLQTEWVRKLHRLPVTAQTELKTDDHDGDGRPRFDITSEQKTAATLMEAEERGYALTLRATHIHWHEPVKSYTAHRYTPPGAYDNWTDSDWQKHNASA